MSAGEAGLKSVKQNPSPIQGSAILGVESCFLLSSFLSLVFLGGAQGVIGHAPALRTPRSGALLTVNWTTEGSEEVRSGSGRSCGESLWPGAPVWLVPVRETPGRVAAHSWVGCSLPKDKAPGGTGAPLTFHSRGHMSWRGCVCPEKQEPVDSHKDMRG